MKKKLVYGIGLNDYIGIVNIDGVFIKSYVVWKEMIRRCYSKEHQKKHPTYIGCTICEEWKYYTNFKKWYDDNYPYDLASTGVSFELDKDLLVDVNKIYSPDNCIFLPKRINRFLTNEKKSNNTGYAGVSYREERKKYIARTRDFILCKEIHLGSFSNPNDANEVYKYYRSINVLNAKQYLRDLGYNEDIINKLK